MTIKNVGVSSRTPFKHWILNSELGRQVGVLAHAPHKVPCVADPLLIIDMCAGDGASSDFDIRSSPSIIKKHMSYKGINSKAILIELNEYAFEELKLNIGENNNIQILNIDAKQYKPDIFSNQAVFINCDPNSINELPINKDFLSGLSRYSTMVLTLGCNVGGLKRLSREKRGEWYGYVNLVISHLTTFHDLILCSIIQDNAQWAYLVRIPALWTQETIKRYQKQGDKMFANGVKVTSFRNDMQAFNNHIHALFLTKKEYVNEIA